MTNAVTCSATPERDSDAARSFSFSARPTFVNEVKSVVEGSFSRAVVDGLALVLERSRARGYDRIQVLHRLGSLLEPLELFGRWVVAPDRPLMFLRPAGMPDTSADANSTDGVPELLQDDMSRCEWWAAAVTIDRDFIWFCALDDDGLTSGDYTYFVQSAADLHLSSFWIVPNEIYNSVRRKAGAMLPPRRICATVGSTCR
jgi:hypothetical protein